MGECGLSRPPGCVIMGTPLKHLILDKEVMHENPRDVTHPGRHRRQTQIPQRSPAGPTGTAVSPGWRGPGYHHSLAGHVTVSDPVKNGGRKRHERRYLIRRRRDPRSGGPRGSSQGLGNVLVSVP